MSKDQTASAPFWSSSPSPAGEGSNAPAEPPSITPNLPAVIKKWRIPKKYLRLILYIALGTTLLVALPILGRHTIVKTIPVTRGLYESLGLSLLPVWDGLVFKDVKSELKYDSGTMKLCVDGKIHNFTSETQPIPNIKARALGPDGIAIQSWSVEPPAATIGPGGEVPFHTEVASPMEHTIEDVNLEFYHRDENAK